MLASTHAATLLGVRGTIVRVEAQIGRGLPGFEIVGLPEREVRESRVRVSAALHSCGITLPPRKLIVNLAPGDLKKTGTSYDLAITLAILGACGQVDTSRLERTMLVGELGLDGSLRPIRGVVCHFEAAREAGLTNAMIPLENALDARFANGIEVRTVSHLQTALDYLNGEQELPVFECEPITPLLDSAPAPPDLSDLRGQASAVRALEIAATGSHHLILVGPPGAGKTMLAQRLPGLLGPPEDPLHREMVQIQSVAGILRPQSLVTRPFRAPHHSVSAPALVGGGEPVRPGEITLAHGGVLFLDELPEFSRGAIESLRTTMESGQAHISRVHGKVAMPASPLVIAAMNPCPCGYRNSRVRPCRCSPRAVERYQQRVTGPILDRFDMHLAVHRVPARALLDDTKGESTKTVRARVAAGRSFAQERRDASGAGTSSDFDGSFTSEALELLADTVDRQGDSARSFCKIRAVARTVADLAGSSQVQPVHMTEALGYRCLDHRESHKPNRQRRSA